MTSTPDIDIDFSTEHREQVIQYVYDKYGWERTGMVCKVVTFQPRMAARQVGKALGFPPDVVDKLAKSVDSWFPQSMEETTAQAGFEHLTGSAPWRQFTALCNQALNFPRHLSIHVGGMLVTGEPLVDIAPVEPATMPGRVVVQFDKDDVEDLGLIKMDMLGLRTLSVVAECLDLVERRTGARPDRRVPPRDEPPPLSYRDAQPPRRLPRRLPAERRLHRDRRGALPRDRRVRSLRVLPLPRRCLRPHVLRNRLAPDRTPGRVLL